MGVALRVLFIEDCEDDAQLVVRELKRAGYDPQFERVEKKVDLVAALDGSAWDLIIADYSMPEFSGTDALHVVRDRGLDMPFIFVSGTIGEDVAVAAMKGGASDYVVKGSLKRLVPAIERELREAEVRRERRRLEVELRHAQRMEAVGRLAGGVAHDFNNLLTVILGFCDLLSKHKDCSASFVTAVGGIKKAGEAAAGLTRQLLALSRRQIMQAQPLDLSAVVGQIERLLRRLIGENIVLQTRLAPAGEAGIVADPGQLEQVILNLAINARDAMPRGGILHMATDVVELEAGPVPDRNQPVGNYAVLTVSDTGLGMDDETRQQIFEPFFTTKEAQEGTGLGLATVYGIVAQSGGFIRVESEPGRGSSFKVFLPRAKGPGEQPAMEVADLMPRGGNETILVVEDSSGVRTVMRRILEEVGYRVIEAADGFRALGVAAEDDREIDLLLTDIVMPGMSGSELAERFQSLRPGVKTLFTSGYTTETVDRLGAAVDHFAFIEKPLRARPLVQKVREVLDRS